MSKKILFAGSLILAAIAAYVVANILFQSHVTKLVGAGDIDLGDAVLRIEPESVKTSLISGRMEADQAKIILLNNPKNTEIQLDGLAVSMDIFSGSINDIAVRESTITSDVGELKIGAVQLGGELLAELMSGELNEITDISQIPSFNFELGALDLSELSEQVPGLSAFKLDALKISYAPDDHTSYFKLEGLESAFQEQGKPSVNFSIGQFLIDGADPTHFHDWQEFLATNIGETEKTDAISPEFIQAVMEDSFDFFGSNEIAFSDFSMAIGGVINFGIGGFSLKDIVREDNIAIGYDTTYEDFDITIDSSNPGFVPFQQASGLEALAIKLSGQNRLDKSGLMTFDSDVIVDGLMTLTMIGDMNIPDYEAYIESSLKSLAYNLESNQQSDANLKGLIEQYSHVEDFKIKMTLNDNGLLNTAAKMNGFTEPDQLEAFKGTIAQQFAFGAIAFADNTSNELISVIQSFTGEQQAPLTITLSSSKPWPFKDLDLTDQAVMIEELKNATTLIFSNSAEQLSN